MRRTIFGFAVACALAMPVAAQTAGGRERAQAALPPEVFEQVDRAASEAARSGLPVGPVWDKALEGAAKHVPAARIAPAVEEYVTRLTTARGLLGADQPPEALKAAADALTRGVPPRVLARVAERRARTAMALVVLGDLIDSGVPADRAVDVVREALARRTPDEDMLALNARVRAAIRQGANPAVAADRVRRALREGRVRQLPAGRDPAGPPAAPGSETTTGDRTRPRGGR